MLMKGTVTVEVDDVDIDQQRIQWKAENRPGEAQLAKAAAMASEDWRALFRVCNVTDHILEFDMAMPKKGGGARVHFVLRKMTEEEMAA